MDTYATISAPDLTANPPASYGELIDYWNKGHANEFFPTSTPDMIEELQKQLSNERTRTDHQSNVIIKMQSQIDSMIERLMELVESDEIDNDVAQDLASFFGRDLVRTVTVRVTADIDVEVTIPVGYDIDDLHGDLEVEVTNAYSSDVEVQGYETVGIQTEEM